MAKLYHFVGWEERGSRAQGGHSGRSAVDPVGQELRLDRGHGSGGQLIDGTWKRPARASKRRSPLGWDVVARIYESGY